MTVIITMAGAGSRFTAANYLVPKHLIKARGKTLFEWSLSSLHSFFNQPFIFACLEGHDQPWIIDAAESMGIKQVKTSGRKHISSGQAETAYDVLRLAEPSEELWIFNIDTYISGGLDEADLTGFDGCAHVFESSNEGMSFCRFDSQGAVVQVAEKKVISRWATVGMYGFSSAKLFKDFYLLAYADGKSDLVQGEKFVVPIYQAMLDAGLKITAPKLDLSAVNILGTPHEVQAFDPNARAPFGCQDRLNNGSY